MRRIFASVIIGVFLFCCPAYAVVVTCTNCSTGILQSLERVTNLKQLGELLKQVDQAILQTEQQIRMVQQGIERYANMVQNTVKLPQRIVGRVQGSFSRLAALGKQLSTLKGDAYALNQIFSATYAGRSALSDLANVPRDAYGEAAHTYNEMAGKWSEEVERSQREQFKVSGQQLDELEREAEELEQRMGELLNTPDGQMQALEAGNTLAAMQIQESQKLRQLLAVMAQASVHKNMKDEKEEQMARETWKQFFRWE